MEGNHLYTAEQILAVAASARPEGGPSEFDPAREKLEATGAFDNVSYRYAPSKDGEGYDVTYEVSEIGQMYPVRFEDLPAGDAIEPGSSKRTRFWRQDPATQPVVDRYVEWISEYLAAQGDHEPSPAN